MLRLKEVTDYTSDFNKIIDNFSDRLRSVREPSRSERENKVFELDNELFKWSFESVAEMRTKSLVVLRRISTKRHRPSLKPSEIFWRMRSRSVFAFLVLQIYVTQKFKKFFKNFDTMYD